MGRQLHRAIKYENIIFSSYALKFLMQISLKELRFFVAAADHQSITLAAASMNVSQPSVSLAIAGLEDRLGIQLLVRHHARGVAITAAGIDVLREARKLLAHANDIQAMASALGEAPRGRLKIACLTYLVPRYLPSLMSSFSAAYPEIEVDFVEGDQKRLVDSLMTGEAELALSYDLDLPNSVSSEPLVDLEPYVIVAKRHQFAGQKRVRLQQLEQEPVILLDLPISRDYYTAIFTSLGITPRIRHRSTSIEAVRGLVANGLGYSILNHRAKSLTAYDGRKLAELQIEDSLPPARVSLLMPSGMKPRRIIEILAAHTRSFFLDL